MNERQIKYMLTIFREGSISRAAEVLYVSQPSVSQCERWRKNSAPSSLCGTRTPWF